MKFIMSKIGAVVVLYKPDLSETIPALKSLSEQVNEVCIVDNTPNNRIDIGFESIPNAKYIYLGENRGIAAAQNIGISYLKKNDFEFVLFSDQDSLAPSETVEKLLNGLLVLKSKGIKVATVGTRAINKQTGNPYESRTKESMLPSELIKPYSPNDFTECYSVMSSMSLTPIENFDKVGLFDESLFIDGVDDEWCWRAWHSNKLRSFVIENATIEHMLGKNGNSILGKQVSISSPFRIYFQYRNYIILSRRTSTPLFWKRNNFIKYFIKMFYYPLFVSPRFLYLKNICKGIKDGVKFLQKR